MVDEIICRVFRNKRNKQITLTIPKRKIPFLSIPLDTKKAKISIKELIKDKGGT